MLHEQLWDNYYALCWKYLCSEMAYVLTKFPKLRVASWPSLEWKNREAVFKRLQVIISFDGMFKIYAPCSRFRNQLWIPKIGLKWWPVTTFRMNSVERNLVWGWPRIVFKLMLPRWRSGLIKKRLQGHQPITERLQSIRMKSRSNKKSIQILLSIPIEFTLPMHWKAGVTNFLRAVLVELE